MMRWLIATAALVASQVCAGEGRLRFPGGGARVFAVSNAPALLRQCSRNTPMKVSEFWTPSSEQISALESLLPSAISRRKAEGLVVPPDGSYHRQYIGIIQAGRRLIYGNFYHSPDVSPPSAQQQAEAAVVVCDGGPSFWGVVFDPESGVFSEFSFNGEG